ncbi:class I SAM-dependent methyltransferase [Mycolicibacterium brisbanense]|uniref:SAM dependent carboxyl methyltransferase n=1 Tax=Mycolicibacterium brisbanense TaxID=146020 RepID=A0A100W4K0_9MYCO|nr:SAM-dependent methyltransferase [Mycolicibacterium brisbanense]MCV7157382.1 SAM-dependent methyltransferase [Mycolicibacterium brisbanense]GAS91498.1 SAM dependent carboxyl methyltransferase [Mycolicibacterium brisbanense]
MPESSFVVRPDPGDDRKQTPSSRLQAAGLTSAITLFAEAARTVPLPSPPQPIVVADYGAGTGHNGLLAIAKAVGVLRGRTRPEHSVLVTHTDTPDNDFTTLFRTLAEDPASYLRTDAASFSSAVGRSYYTQILPSNSINLGWSAWSIQWLGRVPMPVGDHLVAAYSADPYVRAAYARQAAHDWHEFVAFRGRELCPGGKLVVLTMGLADDGDFGYRPLMLALTDALRGLVADAVITSDELHRMSLPVMGRAAVDFAAPFAPSGRLERLSIEHLEVFDAEDRFFNQYRTDHDARAFGAQWAAFCRFALFGALAEALGDARRHAVFFDRLEAGVAARLAAAPEQMRIPLAEVVLVKRPKS